MPRKSEGDVQRLIRLIEDSDDFEAAWISLENELPSLDNFIKTEDSQKIFNQLIHFLGDVNEEPNESSLLYLNKLRNLIERVPQFAKYIDQIKPEEFRAKVPLLKFLTSNLACYTYPSFQFVEVLVKYCPSFKNYKAYVFDDESKYSNLIQTVDSPREAVEREAIEREVAESLNQSANIDIDEIDESSEVTIKTANHVTLIKNEEYCLATLRSNHQILQAELLMNNDPKKVDELKKKIKSFQQDLQEIHNSRRQKKKKIFENKKKVILKVILKHKSSPIFFLIERDV